MTDHKGALTHYSELASQAGLVKALEARCAALEAREAALTEALRGCWEELGWDEWEELTGPRITAERFRAARAALAAAAEPSGSER